MSMLAVTGASTTIVQQLRTLAPDDTQFVECRTADIPINADRYLFAAGLLLGERINAAGSQDAWRVNFAEVAESIERVLACNRDARICVIGSESAATGSYDMAYAGSKAALELYVRTRRLPYPDQQLVGISPGIIEDSGMTIRRKDWTELARRRQGHPKGRFATALEVAKLAHFLLFGDSRFVTGTTVLINGGEHTSR